MFCVGVFVFCMECIIVYRGRVCICILYSFNEMNFIDNLDLCIVYMLVFIGV